MSWVNYLQIKFKDFQLAIPVIILGIVICILIYVFYKEKN